MTRLIAIAAMLLMVVPAVAFAQDTAAPAPTAVPTERVTVGHEPYPVNLPEDQPLVVWAGVTVSSPSGSFTQASVFVQMSEGQWTKMTPCDDIMILCQTVPMRIDDVVQGEQFYLSAEGSQ